MLLLCTGLPPQLSGSQDESEGKSFHCFGVEQGGLVDGRGAVVVVGGMSGKNKLKWDNDFIVLIHQWLPAMLGFPKWARDANKDGHCPKVAVTAPGHERAETAAKPRKCRVRIVTKDITLRGTRGDDRGFTGGGGCNYAKKRQVGQGQMEMRQTLTIWCDWLVKRKPANQNRWDGRDYIFSNNI